jgi:hypothetical protein
MTPVPNKEAITRPGAPTQVIYYVTGRISGSKREVVSKPFSCLVRNSWKLLKSEVGKLSGMKVNRIFVISGFRHPADEICALLG